MKPGSGHLSRTLSAVEYFTFGFGSMVGVGWVVLIDDWLGRGGPAGAMLGFLAGRTLLLPVALTYGKLVRAIPDAGAEIAYAEGVFPPSIAFAAAWTMVLAYAIVCPWEAAAIAWVNLRGIRPSSRFQNFGTFGLLAIFAAFAVAGFAKGDPSNWQPLFAKPGSAGAWLSILLVLQIVPYFMTGFESIGKESEEARPGFDPRHFGRAILLACAVGVFFYTTVVAVASYVFPWKDLVAGHLGTEAAFQRAFGSPLIARIIVFAAFLSLLKIFNGNFVASTRLLFGIGKRGLVHPSLARVDTARGAPSFAIALMAALTAACAFLGDALLVPVTEVGSLAVGVGWLSACAAFVARARRGSLAASGGDLFLAIAGAAISLAIVAMKVLPSVPGSFTRAEWIAFAVWSALGFLFWLGRRPAETPFFSR